MMACNRVVDDLHSPSLDDLLSNSVDAVVAAGERRGIILFNSAAETMFGYTRAQVLGRDLEMLMPERFREAHRSHVSAFLASPVSSVHMGEPRQVTALRSNGEEFAADVSICKAPIDGEWVVTALLRDVTLRDEAESALEALSAERGRLLSVLGHELRTPLTAILGYADLLQADPARPLDGVQRKRVERIRQGALRLNHMIEEILAFARAEAHREEVHPEPTDMAAVVRTVADLVEPLALRKHVALHVTAPDDVPRAETDPGKVQQILINLLGNAIKFTDEGEVRLDLERDGEAVVVNIQDTGTGIAREDQERIFEPFEQAGESTASRSQGTGLGLAISRDYARLLGGDITVHSEPGCGSTFTVRLPLEPDAAPTLQNGSR